MHHVQRRLANQGGMRLCLLLVDGLDTARLLNHVLTKADVDATLFQG